MAGRDSYVLLSNIDIDEKQDIIEMWWNIILCMNSSILNALMLKNERQLMTPSPDFSK